MISLHWHDPNIYTTIALKNAFRVGLIANIAATAFAAAVTAAATPHAAAAAADSLPKNRFSGNKMEGWAAINFATK